jgi:hypothetical protein
VSGVAEPHLVIVAARDRRDGGEVHQGAADGLRPRPGRLQFGGRRLPVGVSFGDCQGCRRLRPEPGRQVVGDALVGEEVGKLAASGYRGQPKFAVRAPQPEVQQAGRVVARQPPPTPTAGYASAWRSPPARTALAPA